MKCPNYIARSGVCNAPDLREEPVTWCCNRWDCQTKADARTLHLQNLESYAKRGDREGWRVYMAQVASAEGTPSADVLRQAFIQSRNAT